MSSQFESKQLVNNTPRALSPASAAEGLKTSFVLDTEYIEGPPRSSDKVSPDW